MALVFTTSVVLSVVVGTLAVSGTAAAAANGIGIDSAIEADGTVEVVFNASSFSDPPETTDLQVWLDGTKIVTDGAADGQYGGHTWTVANFATAGARVTFDLETDGSPADVAPVHNLTVRFADVGKSGVTSRPTASVTVTQETVGESDGNDDSNSAVRVYQGGTLAIRAAQTDTNVFVEEQGGGAVIDGTTGADSQYILIDSEKLSTGATYRVEFDGAADNEEWFEVSDLGLTVTPTETSVADDTSLRVDVTANRGGQPFVARLKDASGTVVSTLRDDLPGDATATLDFGPQSAADGPYTVTVRDNATTALATSGSISVFDASETPGVSFDRPTYTEQRGDLVELNLSLSGAAEATVAIGTAGDNAWVQNLTVRDGDGDGHVGVTFNTYTAGTADNTDALGRAFHVYSVSGGDAIERIERASGSFDPNLPAADTLDPDDYSIRAVTGPDPPSETTGGPNATATLSLQARSTDDLTTYAAPDEWAGEIDGVAEVDTLRSNGTIRQTETLVDRDVLLTRIDASGLEGVLRNRTDNSALNETVAFFDEAAGNGAWTFKISQVDAGPNRAPYTATVGPDNAKLLTDPATDTYWLVVDTGVEGDGIPELEFGDELETTFTMQSGDDLAETDTTVASTWTFTQGEATVETTDDVDGDGTTDEVAVRQAPDQRISGHTTLRPGVTLTARITGTDASTPFVKPIETVVEPGGTWSATANFSDIAVGANFSLDVRRFGTSLLDEPIDGRVGDPFTTSISAEDHETFGESLEVASVTLAEGGFVAYHRSNATGPVVGATAYLPAGSHSDVDVPVSPPLADGSTLCATVHEDTDGDETFEFDAAAAASADGPYTSDGSPVADSASVMIREPDEPGIDDRALEDDEDQTDDSAEEQLADGRTQYDDPAAIDEAVALAGTVPLAAERVRVTDGDATVGFTDHVSVAGVRFSESPDGAVTVADVASVPSGSDPIPGRSLSVFSVTASGASDGDVRLWTRVPISAVQTAGLDVADLQVYHLADGDWEPQATSLARTTDDAYVLEAELDGLSFFAVSARSAPRATIELDRRTVAPGGTLVLDGRNSSVPYGNIASAEWSVGGESFTGETGTVTLEEPGQYTVELVVANEAGQTDTALATVTVEAEPGDGESASPSEQRTSSPATEIATGSGETEATPTGEGSAGGTGPGFGVFGAVLAVSIAGFLARRRV